MTAAIHVLGVRHHGPGSGRAVAAALAQVQPDCVLIEGPPELDAVAALAARVVPPAAALVYVPDRPRRASFYPFASWSPEWLALRWALARGVAVGFCDLPAAHALAPWPHRHGATTATPDGGDDGDPDGGDGGDGGDGDDGGDRDGGDGDGGYGDGDGGYGDGDDDLASAPPDPRTLARLDPIGALAAAAGFDDAERWWDDVIEHRAHGLDVFAAVLDAMRELRGAAGADAAPADADHRNLRREAAMRKVIRSRAKQHERIVVVCGAWHAPVLVPEAHPTASADAALLRGLPRVKVAATWIPWTAARLARASGYGAGVAAPGWYEHLFTVPDDEVVVRWLVHTARALRAERVDVPPASVVDAVRLAETLATLRDRPLAGLTELRESSVAVLCGGGEGPLHLVDGALLVGDAMGSVPDDTPMVPLARDLDAERRRLRLPATATARHLDLDLRQARHVERSTLLHRLLVLDVPWGDPLDVGRTTGTFKERWRLEWRPELDVALIEAGGAGTTIAEAASTTLRAAAVDADVPALTRLVELALVADLPDALATVMATLAAATARLHDTVVLMGAVEPLARVRRYGDVRDVDTAAVHGVLDTIVTRIAVGLPAACAALDDDAAEAMLAAVDATQRGVGTVGDATFMARWMGALGVISRQEGVHGLVAGRATRLRLDAGLVAAADAAAGLGRALSVGGDPRRGAGWVEGFLAGDMALLLHDPVLLGVLDDWVAATPGFVFDDVLPLLRRTFSTFAPAERKLLGAHLRRAVPGGAVARGGDGVDRERGAAALPLVLRLLGCDPDPSDGRPGTPP